MAKYKQVAFEFPEQDIILMLKEYLKDKHDIRVSSMKFMDYDNFCDVARLGVRITYQVELKEHTF